MSEKKTCETCRWWKPKLWHVGWFNGQFKNEIHHPSDLGKGHLGIIKEDKVKGYCKKETPAIGHPVTRNYDYCGQHAEKEDTS